MLNVLVSEQMKASTTKKRFHMSSRAWAFVIGFFVLVGIVQASVQIARIVTNSSQPVANTVQLPPPTAAELLKLVNEERAKVGVAPLTEDPRIDASAQFKAEDMLTRNYFGHQDPISGSNNGLDKLNELDKDCTLVSENITDNVTPEDNNSAQAIYSWVHSPSHYQAMTDPRYTVTGFGVAGTKVVEHFCIAK